MSRRALLLLVSGVLACGAAACGDEKPAQPASAVERDPAPAAATKDSSGCERMAEPKPRQDGGMTKPALRLSPKKTYIAEVLTSCGEFKIRLDARRAPQTGGSFVSLARRGYFDNLIFHRIVAGFVIQGGDPTGTGAGGPGYTVVEPPPRNLQYTKGVVAMAKTATDPVGASGSQFFVVTGEDVGLPAEYALLGKVTAGQDVVDRIGVVPVDGQDRPVRPVVIRGITIRVR